jgi:peptidoglycan lytic transglycosylase D
MAARFGVPVRVRLRSALGVLILAGGAIHCASRPHLQATRPSAAAAPSPFSQNMKAATGHFYAGKSLALAGEFGCARVEFQAAIDAICPPGQPPPARRDVEEFSSMLYDSIRRYEELARSSEEDVTRPEELAGIDVKSASADEIERARSAVTTGESGTTYDLPLVVNDNVLAMIANFSDRIHNRFAAGLERSGRYVDMIRDVFAREGLPKDLVYVAMVESAFKTNAHSPKRAHGLWQFVTGTGRRYGLATNRLVDERSDPVKATEAAAKYWKALYDIFHDWYLSMAAYNSGEGRVLRAMNRTGDNNYWDLCRAGALPRETCSYVPAVLAAMIIAKNPSHYGFDVEPQAPLQYSTVTLHRPIDIRKLAARARLDLVDLRKLNPALRGYITPAERDGFQLLVPQHSENTVSAVLGEVPTARIPRELRHIVRPGDTLSGIAKRYGVSIAALTEANHISRRSLLRIHSALVVPERMARVRTGRRSAKRKSHGALAQARRAGKYRVRRGDTLYSIARHSGATVEQLRTWNHLDENDLIHPGDHLVVDVGSTP